MNRDSTPPPPPPPPLGTPPGVPSQTYLPIVIIDKGVIQNVPSRYPTSILYREPLMATRIVASPNSWCDLPLDDKPRWSNDPIE